MVLVLRGEKTGRGSRGMGVGTISLSHIYINDLLHNISSISKMTLHFFQKY